ncbi:hypothetical protein COU53_03175 [Candidatus Pacearchaeota archaeon CG10_big_fil_rev_8_21_14_0_10_30_48]|nr:MAG: hypothetical protein COU53_03175 [Candidatus Pacearchaeota archaeon CG10_big_fil_rev_8_21_14_0_10_30_48]
MKKKMIFIVLALFLLSLNFASAITITDVSQEELFPGETAIVKIDLKNNLNEDVEDVSFNLVFDNLPFIPIGGSEKSYDSFDEGKSKSFSLTIKSSQDAKPGDYNVPFTLSYVDSNGDILKKSGSIGIVVGAKTELAFDVELKNNVVGENGQVNLKLINSGFGDVKFVTVKIIPEGFTIMGSDSDYIGTVDSNDFESATFDVIFNSENARVNAIVTYKDFYNVEHTENVNRAVKVYSKDEGIELGIIQKNNTMIYIISVVVVIVLWLVYRTIKRKLKKKRKV